MKHQTVVVIGGGATGVGILRDLSMRGIKAVLVEQQDISYGTSSRFHGLLHSGGRYAVKDRESAVECIEENFILKKIAPYSIEKTEGFFVRLSGDDIDFEELWVKSCVDAGIPVEAVSVKEALSLEPNLSKEIKSVYRVPDCAIDGIRLAWQNIDSAKRYGGDILTYTKVTGIDVSNGKVKGVHIEDSITKEKDYIPCDFVVNATGAWSEKIASMVGLNVNVRPDKGIMIAFNHRFTNRVINRLRPASDGDIFVPHGSVVIFGTTSYKAEGPDDLLSTREEAIKLLKLGTPMFENLYNYRILRVFSGIRPLYSADSDVSGRSATRSFAVLDHEKEGLEGMATILGGKFTTYRLMAEKMTDLVCHKLNINAECRTHIEPLLMEIPTDSDNNYIKKYFPSFNLHGTISRLGENFDDFLNILKANPEKGQIICECERVSIAEIETVASLKTSRNFGDIRRKTRLGMGTCQGAFCSSRMAAISLAKGFFPNKDGKKTFESLSKNFIEARFRGIRPVFWGNQIRETELMRSIYGSLLNIDGETSNGADSDER